MTDIVGNATFRSMWEEAVELCPSNTFLQFCGRDGHERTYTYAEFEREANRTANLFLMLGIAHGERVALHMHTCPEFMMCLLGLAKIGAVAVPLNEQYSIDETDFALKKTGARCAVIESRFVRRYRALIERGHSFDRGSFVVDTHDRLVDTTPFSGGVFLSFEEARKGQACALENRRVLDAEDDVEIMFTSGTTSLPKGVVVTQANMVFSGHYGVWETSLRQDDRLLTTMPACHSNFQLAALTPVIAAGATLIVVEKYSARKFWRQVRAYKATVAQCVAMMLRTMLLQPIDPHERDHCLREMLYFLPVSDEEKQAFEQRFGARLLNTYGSTESIGWVLTDPPVGKRNWPSVGRPGLGYDVRIVRDDGAPACVGEVGEIQIRGVVGRSIMKGYFDDEGETRRAFSEDGWLRTGDKGYVDADGWFFFMDRKANMIKRAGENISASEIERVLEQHPLVAEAAVIGVSDPIRDQAVKAFVRRESGEMLAESELRAYCEEHLAAFKVPSFIEFVDDFPRTCSLKVEKKLLH